MSRAPPHDPSAPAAENPVQSIGRYQVVEHLATGGMAEVFLACERAAAGFERLVVIKRLRPHLAFREDVVRMFLDEARLVARLTHPNIAQIHELGDVDGTWFIAMEYVEGSSLRELFKRATKQEKKVPIEVAVAVVLQACAGLHSAHELRSPRGENYGLVHRDVSPDNLMVTPAGFVKVLDFGIAKATAQEDATRDGSLKGKVSYMSPEQCQQLNLDRRSDVFSLGTVLWELLATARLFRRENEFAAMQAIVSGGLLDLREQRPDVPDGIERVALRALRLQPEDRYQTADEMRRELAREAAAVGIQAGTDAVAGFVRDLVGEEHEARRKALDDAVERTLMHADVSELLAPDGRARAKKRTSRTARLAWAAAAGVLVGLPVAVLAIVLLVKMRGPAVSGPTLVLGLAPVMDPAALMATYGPVERTLEESTGRPIELRVTESYAALADAVASGEFAFGMAPPRAYLRARERSADVELIGFRVVEGGSGSDGVLLVREAAGVESVAELRARTICFTEPDSSTGYLLPRAALREAGVDPDRDLGGIRMCGNHLQALRDLASGECDAAGTYSGAWLTATKAGVDFGGLRVLALTGRTPQDAFIAGPGATDEERDAVRVALLAFEPDDEAPEGGERVTGFVEARDSDFDHLRKAIAGENNR